MDRKFVTAILFLVILSVLPECKSTTQEGKNLMTIQLTSPAFSEGGTIPKIYTCDADNVSPALSWSGIPKETKSIALIVDDPDAPAGTFVHWVIYDIPPTRLDLPQGIDKTGIVTDIGTQGNNDFRKLGYGGPCPPKGPAHRYFFKLYALDIKLNLKSGATKPDLEKAMRGHILAHGQLIGKYSRSG
jgi:Raf kinase inhibitor-like YbhB/YbcL family protein